MIVYFDTNVFDHLDRRIGITEWDVYRVKRAAKHECIRVVLSYLNIEETLFVVSLDRQKAEARVKLILELADKHLVARGHHQIIRDDICSYAEGLSTQPPYEPLTPWMESELWKLAAPVGRDWRNLKSVVDRTRRIKQEYENFMMRGKSKLRPMAASIGVKLYPFDSYWENNKGWLAEGLAKRAGVLRKVKRRGVDGLLMVKSVALVVGANLSLLYSHHYENRTPDSGDSRDILHAIAASGADVFVTNDKRLRAVLSRVPVEGFQVMDLRAFIRSLPEWV